MPPTERLLHLAADRFDETVYNTVFEMEPVMDWLLATGFTRAYFATVTDLASPIETPEAEGRVFFVAVK